MSRVIFEPEKGQRVPVRLWAREASPETIRQLQRLAGKPYVRSHVAAMADAHVAEGVAVGTVFATEGVVVPGALGGDLGCGMVVMRLNGWADALDRRALERFVEDLERVIPAGRALRRGAGLRLPDHLIASPLSTRSLEHARELSGPRHLGTLGAGNHFLELDRDADGRLWILVHSGSRGMGAAIASHHLRAAEDTDADSLAELWVDDDAGRAFLQDADWARRFAETNRHTILRLAVELLSETLHAPIETDEVVDRPHNFVAQEEWFGRSLMVHRKGAVAVPRGALALIPGSMGTASYIVEGLGSEPSFGSCSHGAGRIMTRKQAHQRVSPKQLVSVLGTLAWPRRRARDLVEEAPAVYRDIRHVLEDQEDLVARRVRLEPLAVYKG